MNIAEIASRLNQLCARWKTWALPPSRNIAPLVKMPPLKPGEIQWQMGSGYWHRVEHICGDGRLVLGKYEGVTGLTVYVIGDPDTPGNNIRAQGTLEDAMRMYMQKTASKHSGSNHDQ